MSLRELKESLFPKVPPSVSEDRKRGIAAALRFAERQIQRRATCQACAGAGVLECICMPGDECAWCEGERWSSCRFCDGTGVVGLRSVGGEEREGMR